MVKIILQYLTLLKLQHFQDPEWDGPPLPPEEPVERKPKKPSQFKEEEGIRLDNLDYEEPVKKMIKVTLADSTVREIDSMVKTTFWAKRVNQYLMMNLLKSLLERFLISLIVSKI